MKRHENSRRLCFESSTSDTSTKSSKVDVVVGIDDVDDAARQDDDVPHGISGRSRRSCPEPVSETDPRSVTSFLVMPEWNEAGLEFKSLPPSLVAQDLKTGDRTYLILIECEYLIHSKLLSIKMAERP